MRTLVLALALTTTWSTLGSAHQPEQSSHEFTIVISTDSKSMKVGAEVPIQVVLTNNSKTTLDASANVSDLNGADPNYMYEVRYKKGGLVPKRIYKHPELATGHAVFRSVEPGKSITDDQDLKRLFDLSTPGTYIVQVTRHIPNGGADNTVKSNKLEIVLKP